MGLKDNLYPIRPANTGKLTRRMQEWWPHLKGLLVARFVNPVTPVYCLAVEIHYVKSTQQIEC